MESQIKHWCIEHQEKTIGPISSYALALWGLQGLLYPNDIITRNGQRRFLAGYLPGMMPFIRNNGHLHRAKLWAVAGGKGGVGKSVFCALVGVALSSLDKKVVIVDADFGGPNQHDIFGIKSEPVSYWRHLDAHKTLNKLVKPTAFKNLSIIPGPEEAYDPKQAHIMRKIRMVQALRNMETDYVIMDLGPRTQSKDLDFFLTADMQVLLSTGEPTSLENLSRVIKALVLRKAQTAFNSLSRETFAQNFDETADSASFLQSLTEQLRRLQLPADDIFKRVLSSFNIRVIFNMVESTDYAKQSHLLNKYLSNELGLTFVVAGSIHHDPVVHEAIQNKDMQRLTTYRSHAFQDILEITQKLMVTRTRTPESPEFRTVRPTAAINKQALICSKQCNLWDICEFKTPGDYCRVKNWN
ncbi:MAG TPA: P-loop NTPase [bacterium]|nr:P-loop NTPase [bacterium]HPN35136.1 P-loop NTPase [bacterium]